MEELKKELEALLEEVSERNSDAGEDNGPEFDRGVEMTLNYVIGRIETLSK